MANLSNKQTSPVSWVWQDAFEVCFCSKTYDRVSNIAYGEQYNDYILYKLPTTDTEVFYSSLNYRVWIYMFSHCHLIKHTM